MKLIIFALIPVILSIGIIPAIPFSESVEYSQICIDKVWLESSKGRIACVSPTTADKLVERGWGTILADDAFEDKHEITESPELITENKLEVISVSDNISMLIGIDQSMEGNTGGNIGVSAGPDGILVVDNGMPFALDDIRAQLVGLKTCDTCDNIEFLLNTHWHVDHVANNAYFGQHDTTIIAHDNVRELLSSPQEQPEFGLKFDAYPREALPVVTFEESIFVYFNDEQIQVIHLPNAHTNSDSIVYFTESNVLHLGDHLFAGMFPYVDLGHGGSVQGLTTNVEKIINEFPSDVKIIPGHGQLAEMEDLVEYHTMLVETTKIVQDQMDAGKTLEEIQETGFPEKYQKWNGLFIDETIWIQTVYTSLEFEVDLQDTNDSMSSGISAEFPFESHYVEVLGSKLHYIDEGEGDPILFLHGNPTSSYLWRNIIPYVSDDARVIAVDLIGMGKSDKPDIDYRFVDHAKYLEAFIEELELKNVTLVIHDWGSGLGFNYAMQHEDNIKGIAFMEAIIMPLEWSEFPEEFRGIFENFRTPGVGEEMIMTQNIFVEQMLPGGILRDLSEEEMNYYQEPYPTEESRKPVWVWPNEIPIDGEPADVYKIVSDYNQWLQETEIPKILFYVNPGAIFPAPMVEWSESNLKNLEIIYVGEGSHFIQEDHPHEIGQGLDDWYQEISK